MFQKYLHISNICSTFAPDFFKQMIQDADFWYTFLRPTVDWYFRHSYRRCTYEGMENIPSNGAIIYAPNHTNGLMDALAVLAIDRQPKVFVARADIFEKPRIARILNWLKIMPINRVRDGLDQVRKNDETMDRAVEVLHAGVPFCILPEGRHRRKHALLPLQKGIFHIALRAIEGEDNDRPLYIVPIGLDYSDWYHYWGELTVKIGKPIDVRAFASSRGDLTEPQLINAMREELSTKMQGLFPCVADDEEYEENWSKVEGLKVESRWVKILRWVLLVLLSPLAIVCGIVTMPLWLVPQIMKTKVQDPTFQIAILFVWSWIKMLLTLFLLLPFWLFICEYLYQCRKI